MTDLEDIVFDEDVKLDDLPDETYDTLAGRTIKTTTVVVDKNGRKVTTGATRKTKQTQAQPTKPPQQQQQQQQQQVQPKQTTSTTKSGIDEIPEPDYPPTFDYSGLTQEYPPVKEIRDIVDLELKDDMYPGKVGFLPKYLAWAEGTSDAPRAYHLASALSAIAVSLGRKTRAEFLGVTPNTITLLIGDSGDRKSRAMQLASSLLPAEYLHSGSISSSGAYVQILQSKPVLLWHLDEADTFFQVVSATANTPTADLAARIATTFTGESTTYTSLQQGQITTDKPCPTILMGSALSWLRMRKLSPAFLRGGLFARMWLIPAKRTRLLPFPPTPDEIVREALSNWLTQLRDADPCMIAFSHEAKAELSAYQKNAKAPPELRDCGVWARSQASVTKLAVLFHICEGRSFTDNVSGKTVKTAINFVHNFLMPGYLWVITKLEAEQDPVKDIEQRVIDLLDNAGSKGIHVAQLQGSFGRRYNTNDALINLYKTGSIYFYKELSKSKGKPKLMAVLKFHTKKIPSTYIAEIPGFIRKVEEAEE